MIKVGRDFNSSLLQAIGLPQEKCFGVKINTSIDEIVSVSVTYALTVEHVNQLSKILSEGAEPTKI